MTSPHSYTLINSALMPWFNFIIFEQYNSHLVGMCGRYAFGITNPGSLLPAASACWLLGRLAGFSYRCMTIFHPDE